MKRHTRLLLIGLIFFVVLTAAATLSAQRSSDKCECPKDDPSTHGAVQTLWDKELSTADRAPTSASLGFPKVLTVCMYWDPTNKGYPQEVKLAVEGSLDGRMWYPLALAGRETQAMGMNACVQVAPARYVRVGWPPAANIASPGPRVTVQVQAGY
jgi:hypothetical protein